MSTQVGFAVLFQQEATTSREENDVETQVLSTTKGDRSLGLLSKRGISWSRGSIARKLHDIRRCRRVRAQDGSAIRSGDGHIQISTTLRVDIDQANGEILSREKRHVVCDRVWPVTIREGVVIACIPARVCERSGPEEEFVVHVVASKSVSAGLFGVEVSTVVEGIKSRGKLLGLAIFRDVRWGINILKNIRRGTLGHWSCVLDWGRVPEIIRSGVGGYVDVVILVVVRPLQTLVAASCGDWAESGGGCHSGGDRHCGNISCRN